MVPVSRRIKKDAGCHDDDKAKNRVYAPCEYYYYVSVILCSQHISRDESQLSKLG